MSSHPRRAPLRALLTGCAVLALAGCEDFDIDLRPDGINTSDAAQTASAPRPEPDARGVISYPSYQVAVARRGDTAADVAARVGLPVAELASYNGVSADVTLREGEILALPRRVDPAPGTAPIDITTLAGDAIARADDTITPAEPAAAAAAPGPEPVRHQVLRGETAYSIARLYNVSVTALADWNGLGPDLEVREGQYLLIPVAVEESAAAPGKTTDPGEASAAPPPPSAATPLPDEETQPAGAVTTAPLPSPDLEAEKTVSSRLALPVSGGIIRTYQKGKNEGVDFAASAGSAVQAAEAGEVAAITRDTDQVPILVLRHADGLLTVYANIDGITVDKGDKVSRGQTIAKVRAGEPAFLHFEVRDGFESVDPEPYLQ